MFWNVMLIFKECDDDWAVNQVRTLAADRETGEYKKQFLLLKRQL